MYDNSKYAYIVGRLRALDTKMLNPSSLDRLKEAPGASEVFRSLNDLPLVAPALNDYTVRDFNKVLNGALGNMKELLVQMSPYPEVLDFLWYKYDFHNLKVALKAKLSGKGYEDVHHALSAVGTIKKEDWEAFVLGDKKVPLTSDIDRKIGVIQELYEKEEDPSVINMVVDQHYLETLRGISDELGSSMISDYMKRMIDFSNLRAYIRTMELRKDKNALEKVLIEGGQLKPTIYLDSFEKGYEELRQVLEKSLRGGPLAKAFEIFSQEKTLIAVERSIAGLQQEFMAKSNVISFGPEPVFTFFWRFENHMLIIRAILVGKLNGLSNELISANTLSL